MQRPDIDSYFMVIALVVSLRSTCPRATVGAVLVRGGRLLGTGYNGAPAGMDHCVDVGCHMVNGHCVRSVHAEVNAVINCARHGVSTENSVLYSTHFPCHDCAKMLINAGVKEIVYLKEYGDGKDLVEKVGINVRKIEPSSLTLFMGQLASSGWKV